MENLTNRGRIKECFTPFDDYTRLQFRALKVVNQFKSMGFITWKSFYTEVVSVYSDMALHENTKRLSAFWHLRNFNEDFIEKIEILVENLTEEL